MVFASRLIVSLAVSGCFTAPIYADIIPSQYPSRSEAKEKVLGRLTEMGVRSDDARLRTQRLTEEEASYFAENTNRVQVVGQEPFGGQADLFWWEWVLGILAIVGPVIWALELK